MATLKNVTINDTGFVQVATGTTAERVTATNGDLRTNTTTNKVEMYSNGVWLTVDGSVAANTGTTLATGGNVSTVGGYRIHTFTTTGADNFVAPYTGRVEVLVIAGGGGGAGIGGGGGAGGYVYNGNFPVVGGTAYPTVVGAGGTATTHGPAGGRGNNSSFGSLVAIAGAGGCPYNGGVKTATGGSGGGGPGGLGTPGTNYTSYPGEHPGSNGTPGQGHPGGYGHHGTGPGYPNPGNSQPGGANHGGGGGGGAGSKGVSRFSNGADAAGGRGIANTITGSSVIYSAGGGGGTHDQIYAWGPSSGGAGDGTGQGGRFTSPAAHGGVAVQATAGGTNRGGGGGGASHPAPDVSGVGGPGIVVVRYKY